MNILDKILADSGISASSTMSQQNSTRFQNQVKDPKDTFSDFDAADFSSVATQSYAGVGVSPSSVTSKTVVMNPPSVLDGIKRSRAFAEFSVNPLSINFNTAGQADSHDNLVLVHVDMPFGAVGCVIILSRSDINRGAASISVNNGCYVTSLNMTDDIAKVVVPCAAPAKSLTVAVDPAVDGDPVPSDFGIDIASLSGTFIAWEPIEGSGYGDTDSVVSSSAWIFSGNNVNCQIIPIFPLGTLANFMQHVIATDRGDEFASLILNSQI